MNGRKIRLVVSVPSGGTWMADFGMSLANLMAHLMAEKLPGAREQQIRMQNTKGSILPRSRQLMVQFALRDRGTHILMLDSDMVFPRTTAHQLMRWGKPVVAANCVTKALPAQPTAKQRTGEVPDIGAPVYTDPDSHGIERVWRVGTAVMLIDLKVFSSISEPWFTMPWDEDLKQFHGEDWDFCNRLERQGIPVYIDHDLSKQVAHTGLLDYHHGMVGDTVDGEAVPRLEVA